MNVTPHDSLQRCGPQLSRGQCGGLRRARGICTALVVAWSVGSAQSAPALAQAPGTGPSPVAVVQVEQRGVATDQAFVGTVVPLRRSVVGSAVGGRVVDFPINEGDRVTKDQPLAQLLRRSLEIERDAAKAALEVRRQELKELENGSRPEELEQAKAKMLAAKALKEFTQSKLERTTSLVDRQAASQEQLQDDTRAAEGALQAFLEAKAAADLVTAGPRREKIDQAKAQVAAAEEEVKRLEDRLEKHTIRSPFDGYIVKEYTEVGQWIAEGQPVAEVVEVDSVDIEVPVLETYVPQLRVGAPVQVAIDALSGAPLEGRIALIVPQADLRSRTFPVKVRLKNQITPEAGPLLKPGMFARVTLPLTRKEVALLVPKDALVLGGAAPKVFVVDIGSDAKAGKARGVVVKMGLVSGNSVEVSGDRLRAGDLVVVEGNERLNDGQAVTISAAAPEAKVSTAKGTGSRE